jgi:hypothetical protein
MEVVYRSIKGPVRLGKGGNRDIDIYIYMYISNSIPYRQATVYWYKKMNRKDTWRLTICM